MPAHIVEHLDARGRVTVKAEYRDRLKDGYLQILTPDGVLFRRVSTRPLKTKARALDDVDDEAMADL
jgi:DNA-binding transcriptional regulator/RsmH inhibitor MraZ